MSENFYDWSINPEPSPEEERSRPRPEPTFEGQPFAWDALMAALTLLRRSYPDTFSPFNCEHDTLWVNADPGHFSAEELAVLDKWGFFPDGEGGFMSYRFGSA